MFTKYGSIESVRVLSHKNCGFINFELVESAVAARDALLQNEIEAQGFSGARVGFAKIPPLATTTTKANSNSSETSSSSLVQVKDDSTTILADVTSAWQNELFDIMVKFDVSNGMARRYVQGKEGQREVSVMNRSTQHSLS